MDLLIWVLFLTALITGAMTDEQSNNSGIDNVSTPPEDPKECAIVDCAQDLAIEKCPQTCSEPALCQAADCSKEDSMKFCPKTCGEDSDQAKRNVAPNVDKQNIWLQVSGPSLPVYGYKELDFSGRAKCIPVKKHKNINVYGAMTGYDAIQGNPMNSLSDPGVKARIFLHDCKFGYFDFVSDVRDNLQCDSDFSMKTIQSMEEYEEERKGSNDFSAGFSLSGKGGFGAIKVSAAASYTRATNSDQMASEKVLKKYHGEITRAKATCLTHSISISNAVRPVFTPDFIQNIENMDEAIQSGDEEKQKEAVANFVKEFGTHYSKVTKLGAELIYERRFENTAKSIQEKKERNKCVKDDASVSVGVGYGQNEVKASGHYNNKDCEGVKEGSDFSNNEGMEAVKTISRGSRPVDIKKWIDTSFTPVAIERTLDDISNLFQDKWMTKSTFYGFDKDLQGDRIKEMYNKYIEQYCSLILYGILDQNCEVIACRDSNFKCYNGGTCINFEGSPRCECPAETYGKFCEIAWLLVAEEKNCDDTDGVTVSQKGYFSNIVDCATRCKSSLLITMFAFETKEGCEKSESGCQCYCIESATSDCATKNEEGFTLYKFLVQEEAQYLLADTQSECSDIGVPSIVSVNSAEGCKLAIKDLNVANPDLFIEDQISLPKGCYLYAPENKLYFNQNENGLQKEQWSDDTRKVCRDLDIAMESNGGCNEIQVTSTRGSNSQQCRTGVYRIYPETFNQKPTFKHESKQEYLYYMNKGKGFWMFGSDIGVDNGGIINGLCNDFGETQVNVPVESLCPSRWFYWSQSGNSWKLDDTMVVRCRGKSDMIEDGSEGDKNENTARCPIATVTRVREDGKYFYAAQSDLRALYDFDGWDGTTMDVVQERKLGTDINGQEQLQTWTGTIRAWDRGDDSHGRREPSTLAAAGQWKVGDKIKSKDCHPPPASDLCKSSAGDPCLTIPCGVNANCDVKDGEVSCSCPGDLDGDPKLRCGDTLKARCVPYSQQACKDAVTNLGLNFGGAGHNFAGNYDYKGCYTYKSDTSYGKDKITFYGTGGSGEQIKGYKHLDSTKVRPTGYDCSNGKLSSPYMLAEEGVLCSELGKNDAKDIESCKKAKDVVKKLNPSLKVGDDIVKINKQNEPNGCVMKENNLYFNTASGNSPTDGSRQICEGPRCNGYPKTEWDCCNPVTPCGSGEGDCDTDDDCAGNLICGSSRDGSNNCKIQFPYSKSHWDETADCCTEPECHSDLDCNTSSDRDEKICQEGRCLRCRGGGTCCQVGQKCYEGEGDCDYDEDCMPGLRCGVNNCRVKSGYEWHTDTDCCYKPTQCPIITVQRVREEGKFFYATKSALTELFNFNGWSGQTMEVVSEGKLGSWTGTIMAWDKGADSHGRRDPFDLSAAGQWSPGDKIKSKACTIAGIDPCFNGEQNGYENGVDCGGDCEKECATETSRTIPWLLWAAPTI